MSPGIELINWDSCRDIRASPNSSVMPSCEEAPDRHVVDAVVRQPSSCFYAGHCLSAAMIIILAVVVGATGLFGAVNPIIDWHQCAAPMQNALDESVERILGVMYRMDLFNSTKCSPPNCKEL